MLRNKYYIYGDETLEVPAHIHLGKEIFCRMLQYGDNIALINSDTSEKVTYADLAQQTANVALSLARMGIRKGDVVSVCSEKRLEVMPTLLGIVCAGAIYSPFDSSYGDAQLQHRLDIAKPKMIFCSLTGYEAHKQTLYSAGTISTYILYGKEARPGAIVFSEFVTESSSVEEFLPTPVNGLEDRAFIMFSSGTTGLPKGIPLTHFNYLAYSKLFVGGPYAGKRILNTREWYYSYGMQISLCCLRGGATIIFSQRNRPNDWLLAIQHFKIRLPQLTPSTIMDMIKTEDFDKYDLSSVEFIMSASTPLMADQVKVIKEKFPTLINIISVYGMSEAGCVSSNLGATEKLRPGSSGLLSPGFICKTLISWQRSLLPQSMDALNTAGITTTLPALNSLPPQEQVTYRMRLAGGVRFVDKLPRGAGDKLDRKALKQMI